MLLLLLTLFAVDPVTIIPPFTAETAGSAAMIFTIGVIYYNGDLQIT